MSEPSYSYNSSIKTLDVYAKGMDAADRVAKNTFMINQHATFWALYCISVERIQSAKHMNYLLRRQEIREKKIRK